MTSTGQLTGADRMRRAAHLEPVDTTPVWFMRQAGRCFKEYRDLRQKYDILTIAKTPELCTEVTLLPVQQLGVDAAVIFADIMLPLEGMGVPFHIEPDMGPVIHEPIRTGKQIDNIKVFNAHEGTPFLLEAIRMIRGDLGDRAALVGFSGSPFTLACYMIQGQPSRTYDVAKALMFRDPINWHKLMGKVTDAVIDYVHAQIETGVEIVQIFDSWVGILSPDQYQEYVFPYVSQVFNQIGMTNIPTIHFGTANASLLELMASAGGNIMSLDWRVRLDKAWERIGYNRGIQGNLDPTLLLAPFDSVAKETRKILNQASGRPGHIFNLGHGVLPETDPNDLARLVDLVHEEARR